MIAHVAGSGTPLVAIHGFELDHRSMLPLEEMVDGSWSRHYVDLPWAAGAVDRRAGGSEEVAAGVVETLRAHLGGSPFAVVGCSYGAMIARHVAHELRAQVLGLATLVGVFEPEHARREVPRHEVVEPDPSVLAQAGALRADFEELAVVQSRSALSAFERHVLPGQRGADPAVVERVAASYALPEVPEVAHPAPFVAPSLHVFGRQDAVTGSEDGWRTREHYPRGTYVVLDAAGHNLLIERPAVVGALVRDWLLRVETAQRV